MNQNEPEDFKTITLLKSPKILLKESWDIFSHHIGTFLGITILPAVALSLFSLVPVFISAFGSFGSVFLIPFFALVVVAAFFLQLWGTAALIYTAQRKGQVSIKQAYSHTAQKLLSVFWVSILSMFIVAGGYALFIVPGIIFAVWFTFSLYVLLLEDVHGFTALIKSKEYVRDYWWSVVGRLFVLGIAALALSILALLIDLAFNALFDISQVATVLNILISFFVMPFGVIFTSLIYTNLKEIKGEVKAGANTKHKLVFTLIAILGIIVSVVWVGGLIMLNLFMTGSRTNDENVNALQQEIYNNRKRSISSEKRGNSEIGTSSEAF